MISTISSRLALIAMMFVMAIGAASAQPPGRGGEGTGRGDGGGRGDGFERGGDHGKGQGLGLCLSRIELTEEQKADVAARNERAHTAMREIHAEIEALNGRLRTAKEAGDREAAAAIMEEIKAKRDQLAAIERGLMESILALLTPEQTAALRDCMSGKGNRGRNDHHGRKDCFGQLELSDAQKAEIRSIHEAFRAEYADEMQELRELHKLVREARRANDTEALTRLRAAIAEKMEALKAAQERVHNAVLEVLTDEQRAALEDCVGERDGDGDGGRRGGRRGGVPNNLVPQID